MTESTRAVSAATTGGIPYAAKAPAAKTTKSFADELAKSTSTSASSTKVAARPDNEQTKKIAGHSYARIENGTDKGLFLNQLASSPRLGSVFRMVERDDRVFHVYGTGNARVVVELKARTATDTTTDPTADPAPETSTATTAPAPS
jgi:translation elongation factor EF-G